MTARSMNAPGSPSSALQMMYFTSPSLLRARSHLMPVGKPAPPRPRMPEALISSITSSGARLARMSPQRAVPPRGDVAVDVLGVEHADVREHDLDLLAVEVLVGLVDEPLPHRRAADEVLVDDPLDHLGLDVLVDGLLPPACTSTSTSRAHSPMQPTWWVEQRSLTSARTPARASAAANASMTPLPPAEIPAGPMQTRTSVAAFMPSSSAGRGPRGRPCRWSSSRGRRR